MSGWIKLHRKIVDWEWYGDLPTTFLFIHLLLSANHRDSNWRGIPIKRGQYLTSQDTLMKETKLSRQQLRTALKKLEKTKEVTSQATKLNTMITLINYDTYQCEACEANQQINQQLTNEQPTSNQQLTTNNKNKNKKKKEEVYTPPTETLETNTDLPPQTQASFLPPAEKPKPERKLYSSDYYESEYVLLTDVQLGKLRAYYEHHTPQDPERYLAKSISTLDKWFSENPKGLKKSKDHYRALIDWPQEKALTFYKLEMENKRIRSY